MVCQGSYHVKISRRYLTDIRCKEITEFIEDNLEDGSIDWEEYDILMSALPDSTVVHFIDQIEEPDNWDSQLYGDWFPRRLLFTGVPSMHSQAKWHKVVISYLPTSWNMPVNFQNRLGFTQRGLDRIIEFACTGRDCRVGFRLNSCCAHVIAVLLLVSVYAYDEQSFVSSYKPLHMIDVSNPKGLSESLYAPMQNSSDDPDASD